MADPRKEVHDPRTWSFLEPDSHFATELDQFIDGTPRAECSLRFRRRVAKFRFCFAVETSIEEKHARATMAKARHHIGPVRFCLSNRLSMLETWLQRGMVSPGLNSCSGLLRLAT